MFHLFSQFQTELLDLILESNIAVHEARVCFLEVLNLALQLIDSCFINFFFLGVFTNSMLAI